MGRLCLPLPPKALKDFRRSLVLWIDIKSYLAIIILKDKYRFENHTKPINTFRVQNAELLNVTAGGTYPYYCDLSCIIRLSQIRHYSDRSQNFTSNFRMMLLKTNLVTSC
jgi:hypothetical protein